MVAQAGVSLVAACRDRQPVNFPTERPFRAVTLYGLATHLRALAAREPDHHRRRQLERRYRACQRAAREALRQTLGGDTRR